MAYTSQSLAPATLTCNPANHVRGEFRPLQKATGFPPCHRWAPSLLAESDPDVRSCCGNRSSFEFDTCAGRVEFDPVVAIALSAFEFDTCAGEWVLDQEMQETLLNAIGNQISFEDAFALRSISLAGSAKIPSSVGNKVKQATTGAKNLMGLHQKGDPKSKFKVVKHIEVDQILLWIENEENRAWVLKSPTSLHGILDPSFVEEACPYFAEKNTGTLDTDEWCTFLGRLAFLHAKYLLQCAFLHDRAFFARGQPWSNDDSEACSMETIKASLSKLVGKADHPWMMPGEHDYVIFAQFQFGYDIDCHGWSPIPPGWLEDLVYYSANKHPLHGIFCCDPFLPLGWIQRVFMELAAFGLAFMTTAMHDWYVEGNEGVALKVVPQIHNGFFFSLVFVALPGIIMSHVLVALFTCKQGVLNEARSDADEVSDAWWMRCGGGTLGYIIVTSFVAYLIYVVIYATSFDHVYVRPVLLGRAQCYIIEWLKMILVNFNPVIAWGDPEPEQSHCTWCDDPIGWGRDCIGLGRWRIQKQRFQVMCFKGIKHITTKTEDLAMYSKKYLKKTEKLSMYKRAKKRMQGLWRRNDQPQPAE